MNQNHVDVAGLAELEGLAGSHGDYIHLAVMLLFKGRNQLPEQTGVLGGGGGGEAQALLGAGHAADQQQADHCQGQNAQALHKRVSFQDGLNGWASDLGRLFRVYPGPREGPAGGFRHQ